MERCKKEGEGIPCAIYAVLPHPAFRDHSRNCITSVDCRGKRVTGIRKNYPSCQMYSYVTPFV